MTPKKTSDSSEPSGEPDGGPNAGQTPTGESPRILPLIHDTGNRRVLSEWITDHENYRLAAETEEIITGEFDCLIVDKQSLIEQKEPILERLDREEAVLPVVLLAESADEAALRAEFRRGFPDLFEAVNAVVSMPIAEKRFEDRIETLLQVREQSREIAAQRRQLRAIRDKHAGHGVLITDRGASIQYVNEAFEQQSGYTEEEVLGENPRILQSGEHDDSFYEDLWDTILAGDVWQGEVINERKDGVRYVLNQTIAPITDADGDIERFIGVNHEITELKGLEASLRDQREELEILNRVLRHDIRNDLNVILGWMSVLEDHVESDGKEYIERITRSAHHIVELTDVAADLVGDITADSEPELELVRLTPLLKDEVQKRREAFDNATIELDDDLPPDMRVRANSMLASVFRNLINNAVQHNDSDDPWVGIRAEMSGESVLVTVADNGPGIPEGKREQMFDKSQKGLDSEGTGMGLYLVENLVETFGGAVWVEDSEKGGALFSVELPAFGEDKAVSEGEQ